MNLANFLTPAGALILGLFLLDWRLGVLALIVQHLLALTVRSLTR